VAEVRRGRTGEAVHTDANKCHGSSPHLLANCLKLHTTTGRQRQSGGTAAALGFRGAGLWRRRRLRGLRSWGGAAREGALNMPRALGARVHAVQGRRRDPDPD
jgi:hypothetical protein